MAIRTVSLSVLLQASCAIYELEVVNRSSFLLCKKACNDKTNFDITRNGQEIVLTVISLLAVEGSKDCHSIDGT